MLQTPGNFPLPQLINFSSMTGRIWATWKNGFYTILLIMRGTLCPYMNKHKNIISENKAKEGGGEGNRNLGARLWDKTNLKQFARHGHFIVFYLWISLQRDANIPRTVRNPIIGLQEHMGHEPEGTRWISCLSSSLNTWRANWLDVFGSHFPFASRSCRDRSGTRETLASMNRSPYFCYYCLLMWKQCLFSLDPEGTHFLRQRRGTC